MGDGNSGDLVKSGDHIEDLFCVTGVPMDVFPLVQSKSFRFFKNRVPDADLPNVMNQRRPLKEFDLLPVKSHEFAIETATLATPTECAMKPAEFESAISANARHIPSIVSLLSEKSRCRGSNAIT
ncbi:hypothetical protein HDF14_005169 [Edaphobacter lichenicola]|uniref:Uncharacterized protein n=1 Tax=Tunturiibacter gelidiferens TaxID=3069689 RepID=A0A9X0U7Z4_9BACT|nr:hypothetical protein [Edaphobacter lichenicola]